jgi:hypothetical protein
MAFFIPSIQFFFGLPREGSKTCSCVGLNSSTWDTGRPAESAREKHEEEGQLRKL